MGAQLYPKSFEISGYSFVCLPVKLNEHTSTYKLYFYDSKGDREFVDYANTISEAKKLARHFVYYFY